MKGWWLVMLVWVGIAHANDPQTVHVAPARIVELELTPSDPVVPRCPNDFYRWPSTCDPHPPRGYTNVYAEGERLEHRYAPVGVYDITVTLTQPDGKKLTARARRVAIGEEPREQLLVPTIGREVGPALAFVFQATPKVRPDGDICALRPNLSGGCSSADPRYTCSITAPDGKVLHRTGCDEAHLYRELIVATCAAKQRMMESEYAKRFTCTLDQRGGR